MSRVTFGMCQQRSAAPQLAGAFAPLPVVNPAKVSRRSLLPSSNAASPRLFNFWRAFHQSIKTFNLHDENADNQRNFTNAFKRKARNKKLLLEIPRIREHKRRSGD
jgi:hypothetical protein